MMYIFCASFSSLPLITVKLLGSILFFIFAIRTDSSHFARVIYCIFTFFC